MTGGPGGGVSGQGAIVWSGQRSVNRLRMRPNSDWSIDKPQRALIDTQSVHQTRQPVARVPAQPHMHRLARHPIPPSNIDHGRTVVDHLEHRLQALFHNTQLHKHHGTPSIETITSDRQTRRLARKPAAKCQAATGASVARLPEPVPKLSPTNRSHGVHHEPGPHREYRIGLLPKCYRPENAETPDRTF